MRRTPRFMTGVLSFLALSSLAAAADRPNVIVVITDDQGYGDVGAHGNTMIETPHLDALHAESVRLTDFHVDPTCSPSRSAVMSGRYSTRTGVWHTIMGRSLMDGGEETVAEVFRDGGYRTGMFGKWHLGDNYPLRPQDQGFEHVVWHHGGGVGQGPDHWDNDYFDDTYEVNGEWRPFEGYCTDVWFREATAFIERDDDRPFFAYLSTNAPHGPFLVDESYSQPYVEAGVPPTMAKFYGMITNIDENVGRLRAWLAERGLAENTVFVFMTDNGTARGHGAGKEEGSWRGFNAGMRGNKGSEFDGGHRVPCFWSWPAGGIEGGRDVDALSAHVDLLPTLTELCGLRPSGARPLDGASFAACLRGASAAPTDRTMFVHSQRIEHPEMWRKCAVMTERWRLVNGGELYDVVADPAQASDVAADHADVVTRLRADYERWWESLTPVFDEYVRIGVGGAENPVRLMSHDWHTEGKGTPWHQNHVRNGYVSNGPWAIDVERAGEYEVTLFRWPEHVGRAMDCVRAAISIGGVERSSEISGSAKKVSFRVGLEAGPTMLLTTLFRSDGEEHGAYFASVRSLGDGAEPEEGWVSLFDGETLDGWTQRNGTATYRVEDGAIVGRTTPGSPNSFLCSDRDYSDFELRFDVMVDDRLNSGVQIRSETRGSRTGRVNGPQVEIEASGRNGAEAGYLYAEAAGGWMTPRDRLVPHETFRDGEWNAYRVLAVGPNIKVWVNGALVSDLTHEKMYRSHPRGFLGLQVHGVGDAGPFEVRWRNLRLREVRDAAAGWVRLFNGVDLEGWTTTGNWAAEPDGVLSIRPREGERGWQRYGDYIWSERPYGDFILDVEYAFPPGGNSGLFFRVADRADPVRTGIEAQILDSIGHEGEMTHHDHGGIISTQGASENRSLPPGEWNRMIVTARGERLQVDLNGAQIIDLRLDQSAIADRAMSGFIGLQDHGRPNEIRFRNLWLKEL